MLVSLWLCVFCYCCIPIDSYSCCMWGFPLLSYSPGGPICAHISMSLTLDVSSCLGGLFSFTGPMKMDSQVQCNLKIRRVRPYGGSSWIGMSNVLRTTHPLPEIWRGSWTCTLKQSWTFLLWLDKIHAVCVAFHLQWFLYLLIMSPCNADVFYQHIISKGVQYSCFAILISTGNHKY